MSTDTPKETIQRLTRAWNSQHRDDFLAVHAAEVTIRGPQPRTVDADTWWTIQRGFFDAFPDATVQTDAMLSEGNRVLVCWTVTATHEGALSGIEPTGRTTSYREWALYEVNDGSVTGVEFLADHLTMLEQLGVVELP